MVLHATVPSAGNPAAGRPRVSVAQRCYRVGQQVRVRGSGFGASVPYDLAVDGIDFGQSLTDANGAFATGFYPGGLAAGQAQIRDQLTVSDGRASASAAVTVTRGTGALFGAGSGGSPRRLVPFQVWDFAPRGPEVRVYLHYVSARRRAGATVLLGRTAGQCGAIVTGPRQLFPFTPSRGIWTLQFDTARRYSPTVAGKVARLAVAIS